MFPTYTPLAEIVITPVDVVPPTLPQSEPEPDGTRAVPGDEFYRVIHDCQNPGLNYQSRTLTDKIKLHITNEMYVPRRWYLRDDGQMRVDQYSKITFWPERLSEDWERHFFSGMSERQRELFGGSGFGWRDAKANPDELNIYNFILCGGALLKGAGARFREFTLFITQDTDLPPMDTDIITHPDKWFQQGVVGHNADKETFCGSVNQVQGRLVIPTACPSGVAAIKTTEVRRVPPLPLDTFLFGVPVTIVEYCFRGADTLGKTKEGDWYYIQQQVGMSGNASDFVLNIPPDDWIDVNPVPIVDWQKE